MKRKISLKNVVFLILAAAFAIGMCIYAFAAGGTQDDPLVSKSYLDGPYKETLRQAVMDEIDDQFFVDLKIQLEQEIRENISDIVVQPDNYEVIVLEDGDRLESTGSADIILRSGKAYCFVELASNRKELIGLSDLTEGSEVLDGFSIPINHQLIIPRGDGRGIVAENTCYVMAKGEYKIVKAGE